MGRCYSLDLRERVARFVASGVSRRAAAHRFGVSESFAIKLVQHEARSGSATPVRQGRPPGRGKLAPFEGFLIAEVEAEPDITMPELADRLMARHGVSAAPAVLSRFLCRHGVTYKKALMASECARADVAEDRRIWRTRRQPRMRRQPGRLVFIDETSMNTKMTRLRGRSLQGQRLQAKEPFGHRVCQFVKELREDCIVPRAANRQSPIQLGF